jgi:hypothetical protein
MQFSLGVNEFRSFPLTKDTATSEAAFSAPFIFNSFGLEESPSVDDVGGDFGTELSAVWSVWEASESVIDPDTSKRIPSPAAQHQPSTPTQFQISSPTHIQTPPAEQETMTPAGQDQPSPSSQEAGLQDVVEARSGWGTADRAHRTEDLVDSVGGRDVGVAALRCVSRTLTSLIEGYLTV